MTVIDFSFSENKEIMVPTSQKSLHQSISLNTGVTVLLASQTKSFKKERYIRGLAFTQKRSF